MRQVMRTLDKKIAEATADGWIVTSQTETSASLTRPRKVKHKTHAILTLCTGGGWGIVWFVCWLGARQKPETLTIRG